MTVDGPGGQTVLPLDQPFARVGRHPEADVCLPHPDVPSRALYLHATRSGVFCLFLDRDDSGPDRAGIWLAPEESVEVGPYRLRASLLTAEPEDALPSELPSAWGSAKPPLPVMMIYCGTRLKDKRRFRSILSPVGRRPQCALQLKGQKVSGFHCVLFWDQQRLWCVDLNSSNGTQRNGQDIVCEEVVLGDRLEIGEFKLVFQRLSSGGRTGSSEPAELADEVLTTLPSPHDQEQSPAAVPEASVALADWGTQVVPVRSLSRWRTDGSEDSQLELDDRTRSSVGASSDSSAPSMLDTSAADSSVDTSNQSDAERRRLHDELAAELVRLAREREEMQAEWQTATSNLQQKTDQLQAKLDAVEGEAARLERQRAELHAAQQAWQAEQAQVAARLASRGDQLTNLEAELAERTARIEAQLAIVQQQAAAAQRAAQERLAAEQAAADRAAELAATEAAQAAAARHAEEQAAAARQDAALSINVEECAVPSDWPHLEPIAPQTLLEGLATDADPALVDQVATQVQWAFEPGLDAALLEPTDPKPPSTPPPAGPEKTSDAPPPWSLATERLAAEIEQIRQQSLTLAAEKQSLEAARNDWQLERQSILDQLASRSGELSRLESELHRSQETLTAQFEARLQARLREAAAPIAPVAPALPAETDASATTVHENGQAVEPRRHEPHVEPSTRPESPSASPVAVSVPASSAEEPVHTASAAPVLGPFIAEPHAASPEEQAMREFLNTRLAQLDNERGGRRWLWWTVGGAGAVLVAGGAFAVYKWIL